MQYALSQLLIDELLARGYEMFVPPLLVRERSLYGTSHFPEGRDQVYAIKTDNVERRPSFSSSGRPNRPISATSWTRPWTVRTARQALRLYGLLSLGSRVVGQDVKGIKRMHQFDKIEMNAVCLPDQSEALYEEFGQINEWLLQELALPYRVVDKCHGDAGYLGSHRQRDVEVWMSGTGEFMEVMTDTNATDYQARRLNIRYKGASGRGFCHLVNDTGCAMGRLLISILDNYQQPDGAVQVPEALQRVVQKASCNRKARDGRATRWPDDCGPSARRVAGGHRAPETGARV